MYIVYIYIPLSNNVSVKRCFGGILGFRPLTAAAIALKVHTKVNKSTENECYISYIMCINADNVLILPQNRF